MATNYTTWAIDEEEGRRIGNQSAALGVDKCFVTLQKVMEAVLRSDGGNDFKLPRVSKHVAVNGRLPMAVPVATNAVDTAYSVLFA
ncbi:hypothetical protein PC118_g6123 [Phytophthora cactorum]|uniref:Uncharacterized protein n=1 Tax=Phytophthora cactorum TaxID=29920 RepID=A0A8T1G5A7_9STRA|nr:hypothetical protein PC118_g6123 [Phytophthora cactorum]KAG3078419.1 hypothetical protein PC121_g7239 [Phytophthora cactorum]KAG4061277.1 hypothetical protein PC123_g3822 [Phytophthora cactorum]